MIPTKCLALITALADNSWNFQVIHGKDTGDNPYVTVEGRSNDMHVMVTWHTRATGTYRLFHAIVNKHDATLTKIMESVRA